jgi:hypothetical protein
MHDMVVDWAEFLSQPILRRMLRRLYGSVDDYPELLKAYWDSHGQRHWSGVRTVLERARDQGQFDHNADLGLIYEILYATIIYDLAAEPDTHNPRDIAERLIASSPTDRLSVRKQYPEVSGKRSSSSTRLSSQDGKQGPNHLTKHSFPLLRRQTSGAPL